MEVKRCERALNPDWLSGVRGRGQAPLCLYTPWKAFGVGELFGLSLTPRLSLPQDFIPSPWIIHKQTPGNRNAFHGGEWSRNCSIMPMTPKQLGKEIQVSSVLTTPFSVFVGRKAQ